MTFVSKKISLVCSAANELMEGDCKLCGGREGFPQALEAPPETPSQQWTNRLEKWTGLRWRSERHTTPDHPSLSPRSFLIYSQARSYSTNKNNMNHRNDTWVKKKTQPQTFYIERRRKRQWYTFMFHTERVLRGRGSASRTDTEDVHGGDVQLRVRALVCQRKHGPLCFT